MKRTDDIAGEAKILALDIETAPLLAYTFSTFKPVIGIEQIKEHPRIIAVAAQWYGKGGVMFKSEYHDSRKDLLQWLYDLLDEADIVMHYNGRSFDIPWIEGELMVEGFERPSPFTQIDLFRILKAHSRLPSRKLDYAALRLLEDRKISHTGFELWFKCIDPDVDEDTKRKAWNVMRRYAKKDTALLIPLFESMRPWVKLPVPINGELYGCPSCGSDNIQRRGFQRTSASVYQRFQCNDCGSWFRSATRENPAGNYRVV